MIKSLYVFKGYGANKLIKEFSNKGWGLLGLNKHLKKLREKLVRPQDEAAAFDHELCERATILTLSFLYSVIFVHKLDIICLVANLLSCYTTKYYYKMLSYRRKTALQGTLVLAESGRLELRDNILLIL